MHPDPDFVQTPAGYFKTLYAIYLALIIGQVLFAIVAVVLTRKIMINVRFTDDPLIFIVPAFAIGGVLAGNLLYRKKLGSIGKTQSLKDKLAGYKTAFLMRCTALEAPSLLGIVAFLLTGVLFFLLVSVMLIGYFIFIKPYKAGIVKTLDLNYPERVLFNQPHTTLK